MRALLCYLPFLGLCFCLVCSDASRKEADLKGKLRERCISRSELLRLLDARSFEKEYLAEIANDTAISEQCRRTVLFYSCSKYVSAGVKLSAVRDLFKQPIWLRRQNLDLLTSYIGPDPPFLGDRASGIVVVISPHLPGGNSSQIALKIGVDTPFKAEPIKEERLFRYLAGLQRYQGFDSLPVTGIELDENTD